jgi:hypothetical protein
MLLTRTLRLFLVSYVCILWSIMYGRDYARSWVFVPIATIPYALEGERARLYASDNICYELGMSCSMLGTTHVIMSLATTVDLIHTSRVMYARTAHFALVNRFNSFHCTIVGRRNQFDDSTAVVVKEFCMSNHLGIKRRRIIFGNRKQDKVFDSLSVDDCAVVQVICSVTESTRKVNLVNGNFERLFPLAFDFENRAFYADRNL